MIHILLTTLKVLGILLAVVFGIVLSLILIVLFVPIRYKARINGGNINFRVTWILHFISLRFNYMDNDFKYKIKILGITIGREKSKFNPDVRTEVNDKAKELPEYRQDSINSQTSKSVSEAESLDNNSVFGLPTKEEDKASKVRPKKKSLSQKLWDVINNIKFKIKKICGKIKKIKNKISDYKDFLTMDESKNNINSMLKIVFDLLVYILPTKIKGYVKFGMENPETTGRVLGIICMFYGLYGEKIDLHPDFENKVFETDIKLKGRIRSYRVLIAAYRILKNQWLKKLIKFVKTH